MEYSINNFYQITQAYYSSKLGTSCRECWSFCIQDLVSMLISSQWGVSLECDNLPIPVDMIGIHGAALGAPFNGSNRLLHSPNLASVGLSVGHDEISLIGCVGGYEIVWSNCRLGKLLTCIALQNHVVVGIFIIFQRPLTVPLHSPYGRQMPAVKVVQGDCDRVYGSNVASQWRTDWIADIINSLDPGWFQFNFI